MEFVQDLAARLANRVQITSDGHKSYLIAVESAFGSDVDFAQLIKIYGRPSDETKPDTRYSPATCIGIKMEMVSGSPDPGPVSTSYVERANLSIRMQVRRFTRLTNGFSKKLTNHGPAFALYMMYYNFARVHQTLRITPAMAGRVESRVGPRRDRCPVGCERGTNHAWTVQEAVSVGGK